ncbi:MAG: hypothetical protein V7L20_29835 [Nostoc sp.]|uniref:hypothetical protein n=1 Tax=Nostoc sp. TaxID=1180 RepID=UPI002FF618AE
MPQALQLRPSALPFSSWLRPKRSYAAGFTTTPFDYQEDKLRTSERTSRSVQVGTSRGS